MQKKNEISGKILTIRVVILFDGFGKKITNSRNRQKTSEFRGVGHPDSAPSIYYEFISRILLVTFQRLFCLCQI
jgi:hypothetical protein